MKRVAVIIVVLFVLGGGAAWYFYGREEAQSPDLLLYGNVDIRQVELAFRVTGRLAEMRFEEGDAVQADELVATLDAVPFDESVAYAEANVAVRQAQLANLEAGARPQEVAQGRATVAERQAALDNATRVLERQQQLVQQGNVSQSVYDDALTGLDEAQARLESAQEALELTLAGARAEDIQAARANLQAAQVQVAQAQTQRDDTQLYAPSDGTILTRMHEPGAIVSAGQTVFTLSLDRPVWVRAYVDEPDLGLIRPGLSVEVVTDTNPNQPYTGQIGFISPTAEFTPRTVETTALRTSLVYRLRVIVAEPDDRLRQGMPVTVRIANARQVTE
ncbi:MAG: secretion protein HlyD [Pseudomonadota bacterium]